MTLVAPTSLRKRPSLGRKTRPHRAPSDAAQLEVDQTPAPAPANTCHERLRPATEAAAGRVRVPPTRTLRGDKSTSCERTLGGETSSAAAPTGMSIPRRGKRSRRSRRQANKTHRHSSRRTLAAAVASWLAALLLATTTAPPCNAAAPSQSGQAASERQIQLLRNAADVELSRQRGSPAGAAANSLQRLQRETDAFAHATHQGAACGYPGSPAHASVTFNTSQVAVGTAASYTCDNGYELLGPPRRVCQANGTWSPIGIPFCVLNVGLGKAAMQSSTAGGGSAQKAVDGSTSPYFQAGTCTMTDVESAPWWYVNLLEPYLVQIVRIDFGTACCANRQKATIAVRVGNNRPDLGNNPLCNRYNGFIEEGKPLFLPCTRPAPGAFVSIHLESPSGSSLSICETFIYTDHALSIEQCPSFRDQPLGSTATYNGKCYLFHNNQVLGFDGARKYCESRGGSLVDETSPALQGFLSWELYRRHRNDQLLGQYWLGAVRDSRQAQNWKWINGKDVQISFWNSLGSQGNCSRFDGSKGWLWSDTDCSSELNFICQYRPLSCGKPEKPTNSTLLTKNIDNGTVIEYQCAPGNLLMGPKSRVCLPTGFFSEFAPKCKYLDCQLPATIPNGDYKLHNGTTAYQSFVTYTCNEGFQMYGRATLSCDVDERWNGPPPRCEPLLCPAPVAPSNGYVTVTSNITTPGTLATYDCRPGYELVGERLLSCLQTGSWDNSFPYCREKRQLMPHVLQMAPPSRPPPGGATSNQRQQPQQAPILPPPPPSRQPPPPASNVQFPADGNAAQSNRPQSIAAASSTTAAPPQSASTTSLPASLNGLASQYTGGGETRQQPQGDSERIKMVASADQVQPQQAQPPKLQFGAQLNRPATPTQTAAATTTTTTAAATSSLAPALFTTSSPASSTTRFAASSPARQFGQPQSSYDSSPLAATNSISVHSQSSRAGSGSAAQTGAPSSTVAATTQAAPTTTTTTTSAFGHSAHHLAAGNVLASLGSQHANVLRPQVNQNALANAKYSLDGIIAVAIFGGFIFLGAIITILVIIVRRKTSQSSAIDAQTISTFDSSGAEHNGLYRNYQQAWENLRFSAPGSQPKSSGHHHQGGGARLIEAHVTGGPSGGLKNYAAPVLAHHLHHHHNLHGGGHHNLALADGSSSSHSSSLLGGGAGAHLTTSGLGGDHLHLHRHSLAQMHRHCNDHLEDDDDELDDDDDEQGVISADETCANGAQVTYRRHGNSTGALCDEGLRDSNELTINADTATMQSSSSNRASRRRLYSTSQNQTSSVVCRSIAAAQQQRRSLSNLAPIQQAAVVGRSGAAAGAAAAPSSSSSSSANSSSQHQRLVSSSTSSTSAGSSSRESPQGDGNSLERLAYGNNWHHSQRPRRD